jgi:hypothetical protein
MATKKSTVPAARVEAPVVLVSLLALTPLRVDGLDVAEQDVFETDASTAESLVAADLATPADPA